MAWAVRGRSSAVFGPSVYRGVQGRRAVALTFDDGPGPGTPPILEILARYGASATFFQCGENVRRAPELSLAVKDAGHEIGNHSDSHLNCAMQSRAVIREEFVRAQETIRSATGILPTLMRAPYGVRWFGFREMQKELQLTGVMWTLIGRDWRLNGPAIARRVNSGARDGFIVCLHDGRGTSANPDVRNTIEAVRRIVPTLLAIGYHFETVSQILCPTIN
jgi:peptidoglycan/xylan/chitin deacetylase (PgdA/CDA1 family)